MIEYDNIVVGSGIAGLTTAAYLAKDGKSVAVLEKESKFGGLTNSFFNNGILFDTGAKALENCGILFPMLEELGIDVEFVKNKLTIIIGKNSVVIDSLKSIDKYGELLINEFPDERKAINKIIKLIKRESGSLNDLCKIENPYFSKFKTNTTIFEKIKWFINFSIITEKIKNEKIPVNEYLKKFTKNSALIDVITQHHFSSMQAFYGLSAFSLYNDCYYPIGGIKTIPEKLIEFLKEKNTSLYNKTQVIKLDPELKILTDNKGYSFKYKNLIWTCDIRSLYRCIDRSTLKNSKIQSSIIQSQINFSRAKYTESVFTTYITVNKPMEYFSNITTGHCLYTPEVKGISGLKIKCNTKEDCEDYIRNYLDNNTFEISIPALRDRDLITKGVTGIQISVLFDFNINLQAIHNMWANRFKELVESVLIEKLIKLYPEIENNILFKMSIDPYDLSKKTEHNDGAIGGWSYSGSVIPSERDLDSFYKSTKTSIKDIYQAGMWSFTPSKLPISILTGKLAAKRVLSKV